MAGALDSVVGRERLPEHSDMPNLPYLMAVLAEVLRWRPVLPFGTSYGLLCSSSSKKHSKEYLMLHWSRIIIKGTSYPKEPQSCRIYGEWFVYHVEWNFWVRFWRHMTHDGSVYSDPDSFRPESWLNEKGRLDQSASILDNVAFGFGRRYAKIQVRG